MLEIGQRVVSNIDGDGVGYDYLLRGNTFSGIIKRIAERKIYVQRDDGVISEFPDGLWEIHIAHDTVLINPKERPFILQIATIRMD